MCVYIYVYNIYIHTYIRVCMLLIPSCSCIQYSLYLFLYEVFILMHHLYKAVIKKRSVFFFIIYSCCHLLLLLLSSVCTLSAVSQNSMLQNVPVVADAVGHPGNFVIPH